MSDRAWTVPWWYLAADADNKNADALTPEGAARRTVENIGNAQEAQKISTKTLGDLKKSVERALHDRLIGGIGGRKRP